MWRECTCVFHHWLMVRNAENGPRQGDLLFVGTSGAKPDSAVAPWSDLPFTIEYSALGCDQPEARTGFDDYALIVAPGNDGASLRLETKESGTLSYSTANGTQQLLVKNAFSVLTRVFGYWEFCAMAKWNLECGGCSPSF